MAAPKFWNVTKANAEIAKLFADNESLTKKLAEAEAATGENESEAVKAATQLEADLATAKQTISTLTSERDTANASLASSAAEIAKLKDDLLAKDAAVEVKVSRQLANVQASLGQQPPVAPEAQAESNGKSLFGIDRFIAAEKREAANRLAKQ